MGKWIDLPVDEMVERYVAGESTYELARAYCVCQHTAWHRLRAAGLEMRPRGEAGGGVRGSHKPGGPLSDNGQSYLISQDREGKNCRVHRACWEAYHGPIPKGHIVHHVDSDRQHNAIENLKCMTNSEHARLHAE